MTALLPRDVAAQLRLRLLTNDVRQGDVAQQMTMDPARLSRILNSRQIAAPDFEARFHSAVDEVLRLRAERALASVGQAADPTKAPT
jgi:hypothetical protein